MADNDATIAKLHAQITYLLAKKAVREVEDKKDEEEAENPQKEVGDLDLAKQVKEIKHALARSQGDQILDFEGLCLFPDSQLPEKFKMPNIEKFNGIGNPTSHIHHVINTLKPMGLNDELIAQLFQRTLTRSALDWFLALEFEHYHTWPKIANAFIKQYVYNVQVELTTQDLEMTMQESNEDFITFVARWGEKATKMKNRPSEEDQVRIFFKNLQSKYLKHTYTQAITYFKRLHATGLQIEEGIELGFIGKEENPPPKKTFPTRISHTSVNTLNSTLP
ncbi:hypothetical protein RHMOL_Rhmol06G0105400 [Rhododendron molle]|uniref:Uncharacterized protein n=1 Tax=Rhododendron molle TaxID=49168 RepID=A0ACC0NCW4_RHOML|nr:hypothetical protein RHMOL_Rhmol06G0105400 [Rhododendron molle]